MNFNTKNIYKCQNENADIVKAARFLSEIQRIRLCITVKPVNGTSTVRITTELPVNITRILIEYLNEYNSAIIYNDCQTILQ